MLSELFVLVVTTITPVQGTPTFTSTTVNTPGLTLESCTTQQNKVYNEAVEKKLNVVIKCVPQQK